MLHNFCIHVECPHHREWSYNVSIGGETATTREYTSEIKCSACMLHDPTAEGIFETPPECIHHEALVQWVNDQKAKREQWEKEWQEEQLRREKEKMWERLERV